jgi:hypothetical protein
MPFAPSFAEEANLIEFAYGAPRPFGFEVPYIPWALATSAAFAVLGALPCFFGPLYAFLPGFNNFGAVVLPGDKTRAAFRRIRPVLQRRTELAFFFENRGPRLARLAPWARVAQISGFLLLVGGLFIAAFVNQAFTGAVGATINEEDFCIFLCMGLAPVLVLGPYVFSTSKNDAHAVLRLGSVEIPVVLGDLLAYALVLAVHIAWPLRLALSLSPNELQGVKLPDRGPWRWLAMNGFWALYPALDVAWLGVILTLLARRRSEAKAELDAIKKAAV